MMLLAVYILTLLAVLLVYRILIDPIVLNLRDDWRFLRAARLSAIVQQQQAQAPPAPAPPPPSPRRTERQEKVVN